MDWSGDALKIADGIVGRIAVPMVDMTSIRDRPKRRTPYIPMEPSAATREVPLFGPEPVESTIEVLAERIEHDWISKPGVRLSAELHPFSVDQRWSGVHLTVLPSLSCTATSGAFLRVSLGPSYRFQPHGVRTSPSMGRSIIWHVP
jgi:hypothetical protein